MTERLELDIARLGAQGDGVAMSAAVPVYVPFTLPGERVVAEVEGERGKLVEVLTPSPDRVSPPCPHFGTCGGCALQHVSRDAYHAFKRASVVEALRQRGIDARVRETLPCSGPRRRAALSALHLKGGVALGFHEAGTHNVVDLTMCPVLHPAIVAAFPALRALAGLVTSKKGETRVIVTWTRAGLDVVLDDVNSQLSANLRTVIAKTAEASGIARVSVNRDPVYEVLIPTLAFGSGEVVPPPGAFLQAVSESEADMADLILANLGKAKSVADLFCGLGAFTFRMAQMARVLAVDSDKAAIAALQAGAKKAQGLKPIETRVRDLFREPLSATELNAFDAVVFDPPRAGAEAQARMIARSKVKTIVAVSCSPATLARDTRILMDGGYALDSVTPIDQFQYSPHVEAVAVFRR